MNDLGRLRARVVACACCPRLVAHRTQVASTPPRRHAGTGYWAKPVPGIGDPAARLLVVGLAPGAHGANRTGLPFHGDGSGAALFRALCEAGFASQPAPDSELRLLGTWVTNAVKCAPPGNSPSPAERRTCAGFLREEVALLPVEVVVALGALAWSAALEVAAGAPPRPRPRFAHLAEAELNGVTVVGSYHPSRQNTNTGRLTLPMLAAVFRRARQLLAGASSGSARGMEQA